MQATISPSARPVGVRPNARLCPPHISWEWNLMYRRRIKLLFLAAVLAIPALGFGSVRRPPLHRPATQAQIAALNRPSPMPGQPGDNAWMLVSAALVLLMTGRPRSVLWRPGAQEEHPRHHDAEFAMMCLVTVLWLSWATLWPSGTAGLIGGFRALFCAAFRSPPTPTTAATIPEQTSWSTS